MNMVTVEQKSSINNLSQSDFLKIERAVLIDDLKDEYRRLRKEAFFNLEKQLESWMSNVVSHNTVRVYANAIDIFLEYVNHDVLNISVEKADEYIWYLKKRFGADKTVKVYLGAVSSFYSHLTRYSYTQINPFKGTKVTLKDEPMKKKVIPTEHDIKSLDNELQNILNRKSYNQTKIAITLMNKYGIRKGFLDNMELVGNKLSSFNKGKVYKVTLQEEEAVWMSNNIGVWQNMKSNTIVTYINKAVNNLVRKMELNKPFSVHCFRHKFAIDFYNNSGHDIERLRLLLNHGSFTTTQKYLRELDIEVKA